LRVESKGYEEKAGVSRKAARKMGQEEEED